MGGLAAARPISNGMSEMRFEDQQNEFGRPPAPPVGFDISGRLVTWGIASSRQQAEYILAAIGVLVLAIAIFVYIGSSGTSNVPTEPNYGNITY